MMRAIRLKNARTNNLQDVSLEIEPGTLLVVVGPSGAGKSSLAFSTLYAEGQRRYVESFSAYARQFLERLPRPPVERLDPVPAAIAVDRQSPVRTSRATVGSMTEVTEYAKELWAHFSALHCPRCGAEVREETPDSAVEKILSSASGQKSVVSYPVEIADAERFFVLRESLVGEGYRRVWDGEAVRDLDEASPASVLRPARPGENHQNGSEALMYVVADRVVVNENQRSRLVQALEVCFERGQGRALISLLDGKSYRFSRELRCDTCQRVFKRPTRGEFSYNSPLGACEACKGFGRTIEVDWDKVISDPTRSLRQGAIRPWSGKAAAWERRRLVKHCEKAGIDLDRPFQELSEAEREFIIEGDGSKSWRGWFGVRRWFRWLEKNRSYKMHVRVFLSRYRKYETCSACGGARLKPESLWWKLQGLSLGQFYALSAEQALGFIESVMAHGGKGAEANSRTKERAPRAPGPDATPLDPKAVNRAFAAEGESERADSEPRAVDVERQAGQLLSELLGRLRALCDVGLGYLTLDRAARTLSGGELQRVALTAALGAKLTGAMFVLEEPSTGLHPADVDRLFYVVRALTPRGNVALVVDNDPVFIRGADRVVELGPGAGSAGGRVVFDGAPEQLLNAGTLTSRWLTEARRRGRSRRKITGWLRLRGARGNNLKSIDLAVPLGVMTCVTGVSGSGKSSLVLDTLLPAVERALGDSTRHPLAFDSLEGFETLDAVIGVDQAPLSRTSRGNPATYVGAWEAIRKLFAKAELSRERGYNAGYFSFNVTGGRCEACKGEGFERVEMQFLADLTFSCPQCAGRRFIGPVLDVRVRGKSIAEILELTAEQAAELFGEDREVQKRLTPLLQIGLGYLRLGQPLSTLSGGESQRLKLAAALGRTTRGALLVLDEPTAGLHPADVEPLMRALAGLVDAGNSVLLVEHDMTVAAAADHVIDLGPGAGERGGELVAQGAPEQLARDRSSKTAPFLAAALAAEPLVLRSPAPAADRSVSDSRAIEVVGAREHNLRAVDVEIPREKLVVLTGPSGSGKSTLAFDTLYAEGQRRYLETVSPYARQYLPQLPRPAVDRIIGLPPCVSLEQRTTHGAFNSTVATVTEIAHYLRLLFARVGLLHCPSCGLAIAARQPALLAKDVRRRFGKAMLSVLSPVVRATKGAHRELISRARDEGFTEARIDGAWRALEPGMKLERYQQHDVDLVVARLDAASSELLGAMRTALGRSGGVVRVVGPGEELLLSSERACPACGKGFAELDPRLFSFNTKQGACPSCEGRGFIERRSGRGARGSSLRLVCDTCHGRRLGGLALHVTLGGRTIADILSLSVEQALPALRALKLLGRERLIGEPLLKEIEQRLGFLARIGLGYLNLDRAALSLSGGEMQRVRLAGQLGSGLTGLLYVLDEPTIGLHARDTAKLLSALRALVGQGCTVLVVEHDAQTIRAADYLVDMGPGGGPHGGRVLAQGSPEHVLGHAASITGRMLAREPAVPKRRRSVKERPRLVLRGASEHNLRDIDLELPLGCLVAVTGVSGSGKSTLVREIMLRALRKALGLTSEPPGAHRGIEGFSAIRRAVEIDQTPIGKTPRSVPATYVGVWDEIRKLFAATPQARVRGYTASRFSFNVAGGRCESCEGQGAILTEMSFLPQASARCDACNGLRFNPETLEVRLHGLNAGELLKQSVEQVGAVLSAVPRVRRPLKLLSELGLGYLALGQASNTLSGGEAQRLKLVAELSESAAGPTLYVMDEPTTGLHREDVARLMAVLSQLVERGDTVVVIEHHPDVVIAADWVVDLGPEGGEGGGTVVAQGTPEQIMAARGSHTGAMLRGDRFDVAETPSV
ncbi:MAG: excinuclease ABC subunit UvrA [Deltaproteobacteria bacterium]|nr:excinuclease ABC subunit UvrA [Deltaproteobacteria bacterium]